MDHQISHMGHLLGQSSLSASSGPGPALQALLPRGIRVKIRGTESGPEPVGVVVVLNGTPGTSPVLSSISPSPCTDRHSQDGSRTSHPKGGPRPDRLPSEP